MSEYFPDVDTNEQLPENIEKALCQRLLGLDMQVDHGATILEGFNGLSLADHKALEAHFHHELVRDATTLMLQFDQFNRSDSLKIKELRIPLKASPDDTSFVIRHNTKEDCFFSAIEANETMRKERSGTRIELEGFGDTLLRIYDISFPPEGANEYRSWKYQLLDRAHKWQMREQSAIAQHFVDSDISGEVTLTRETQCRGNDTYALTVLSHKISLFARDATDDSTRFIEKISVHDEYDGSRQFGMTQHQEIIASNAQSLTIHPQEIQLTPETYPRFNELLSLAEQTNLETTRL